MLVLPATVTTLEARDTQRMLSQALQQEIKSQDEPRVTVDAAGLQQFDSAALAVLRYLVPAAVALFVTGSAFTRAFYTGGAFTLTDAMATGA